MDSGRVGKADKADGSPESRAVGSRGGVEGLNLSASRQCMQEALALALFHTAKTTQKGMGDRVPLYNLCLSDADLLSLIEEIRSSSYIDEVESGEGPREESFLYTLIQPVKENPKDTSINSLIREAGEDAATLIVVNDEKKDSVLVVQLAKGIKVDEMKVAPKDVLEVCHNLLASDKMDLSEVSQWAHS